MASSIVTSICCRHRYTEAANEVNDIWRLFCGPAPPAELLTHLRAAEARWLAPEDSVVMLPVDALPCKVACARCQMSRGYTYDGNNIGLPVSLQVDINRCWFVPTCDAQSKSPGLSPACLS